MVIKIIAYGFIKSGPESYIRNNWNILDFIVVMTSLFSLILEG